MEKEVYIRSPGEMPSDSGRGACVHEVPYHDRVIWKVHKAMNGLRQSPRLFQDHLAQNPTKQSWGKLKRLGPYLKGHRESSLMFELTSAPEVLKRWVMLIGEAKGLIRGVRLEA